jgi:2-C-methyl-D-erythritol 4-phosphate cytidylyltransferase
MLQNSTVGALILIAGEGKRLGGEIPKQFLRLSGKRVYLHTLETFLKAGCFDEILLVCHPDWIAEIRQEAEAPGVRVVAGDVTRQRSVFAGLQAFSVPPKIVVIHDGVRPFVSQDLLKANVLGALEHGAIDTCTPSADTLVFAPGGKSIEAIPKRADFLRGQTPQSFLFEWILAAHQHAIENQLEATDDCKLVLEMGRPVSIVMGDEINLKITTELDLFVAEQILRLKKDPLPTISKQNSLKDKLYAVVGGTGGIGSAICAALHAKGAKSISLSRKSPWPLNLSNAQEIPSVFAKLYEKFGLLDGLINCAGKLTVKPVSTMTLEEIEEMLAVNLRGLILSCKQAQVKPGGHVINLASSSFSRGRKESGVYSCTKAAVVNFTQAFAEERPELQVWALIPQRTRTEMRRQNFPLENPADLLDPEEIASQVVHILQESGKTGMLAEIRQLRQR